ncbi:hypothetical protein G9A89_015355 [Geosiphon pyriformis]|nr:hypothetical protein G9A89_015355 [Geosiphon pyriformis]
MPKKNEQDLQKPKKMPKASVIPSNLTTPAKNLKTKPETEMTNDPSTEIRLTSTVTQPKREEKAQKVISKKTCRIPEPDGEPNHQPHKKTHDQKPLPYHNTDIEH